MKSSNCSWKCWRAYKILKQINVYLCAIQIRLENPASSTQLIKCPMISNYSGVSIGNCPFLLHFWRYFCFRIKIWWVFPSSRKLIVSFIDFGFHIPIIIYDIVDVIKIIISVCFAKWVDKYGEDQAVGLGNLYSWACGRMCRQNGNEFISIHQDGSRQTVFGQWMKDKV